jgi:hypothetical protein
LNDAVLRAFEQELHREVTRPAIAGLMGAYGAALSAMEAGQGESTLLSAEELKSFTHTAKPGSCNLCSNHCTITVNTFPGGDATSPATAARGPRQGEKRVARYVSIHI